MVLNEKPTKNSKLRGLKLRGLSIFTCAAENFRKYISEPKFWMKFEMRSSSKSSESNSSSHKLSTRSDKYSDSVFSLVNEKSEDDWTIIIFSETSFLTPPSCSRSTISKILRHFYVIIT